MSFREQPWKASLVANRRGMYGVPSKYVPLHTSVGICSSQYIQIISALHRRFPKTFTPALIAHLGASLSPGRASIVPSQTNSTAPSPAGNVPSSMITTQTDKDDTSRITRQRPVLRVSAELSLVGIIRDTAGRSGGEWIMKIMKELVSLIYEALL